MAAIRGRDTAPELVLRRALHARGFRYRIDARDLPGRPDLKLTRHGAVIFVHGCFWHGHDCPFFRLPKSNVDFWRAKIERNRARDGRVVGELKALGWRVAIVWECALQGPGGEAGLDRLADALAAWLEGPRRFVEFAGRPKRSLGYARNDSPDRFAAERAAAYRGLTGPGA